MKIIERLELYIKHKKLSLSAFDKSIEASNGYIGKQIRHNASIGGDVIEKIVAAFPELSLRWLITGQGQMIQEEETAFDHIDVDSLQKKASFLALENDKLKDRIIELQDIIINLTSDEQVKERKEDDG